MTQLIVSMSKNGIIGHNNKLPWDCEEELSLFNQLTMNKTIIVGRKTCMNLPILPDRNVFVMTNTFNIRESNNIVRCIDNDILRRCTTSDYIIAGGAEIYKLVLQLPMFIKTVHLSVMKLQEPIKGDTFFDIKWLCDFVIDTKVEHDHFTRYTLKLCHSEEHQYLQLVNRILSTNTLKNTRSGKTLSVFHDNFTFDLQKGFPLITTKKMFIRGIIAEFIFFIKGQTDTTILSDQEVNIWKGNTTREFIDNKGLPYNVGVMGPMYGYQWRFFNAPYSIDVNGRPFKPKGGVDQLSNVLHLIKNDPTSRRILLTSYNPSQAEEGVLYPCHSIIVQFYVHDNHLDMFVYNRSQDIGLGVPFNIASSSLLLLTVAKLSGKIARNLHMTMGDAHIYEEHIEALRDQLSRIPYDFPTMSISDNLTLDNITPDMFTLTKYHSHGPIRMHMKE